MKPLPHILYQPTLSLFLEKTGLKLGKNWDHEIYKNECAPFKNRFPVHDDRLEMMKSESVKVKDKKKSGVQQRQGDDHPCD